MIERDAMIFYNHFSSLGAGEANCFKDFKRNTSKYEVFNAWESDTFRVSNGLYAASLSL
jgi:hypothetical protein